MVPLTVRYHAASVMRDRCAIEGAEHITVPGKQSMMGFLWVLLRQS